MNTFSLETATVVDRTLDVEADVVWQIRRVHLKSLVHYVILSGRTVRMESSHGKIVFLTFYRLNRVYLNSKFCLAKKRETFLKAVNLIHVQINI